MRVIVVDCSTWSWRRRRRRPLLHWMATVWKEVTSTLRY